MCRSFKGSVYLVYIPRPLGSEEGWLFFRERRLILEIC